MHLERVTVAVPDLPAVVAAPRRAPRCAATGCELTVALDGPR